MAINIVVTDHSFHNLDVERDVLSSLNIVLEEYQCKTVDEVVDCVQGANAILTQWAPIRREVIEVLNNCKVIVRYGIGVDNVDLEAAGEKGIPVVNVPDYALDEVADHTMALLLTTIRKIPQVMTNIRQGIWDNNPCRPMYSLSGRTLGLIGFGNIAKRVAYRAKAFGIHVMGYDPYISVDQFSDHEVENASWEQIISESDFISLHQPLTPETHYSFNKKTFQQMKEGSFLINTSRGGLVKLDDLIPFLEKGHIAGIGLDVMEKEPMPPHSPLLKLQGVTITSHCAWYTEDALNRLKQYAAEEILRVFQGEKPKHVVNEEYLKSGKI